MTTIKENVGTFIETTNGVFIVGLEDNHATCLQRVKEANLVHETPEQGHHRFKVLYRIDGVDKINYETAKKYYPSVIVVK